MPPNAAINVPVTVDVADDDSERQSQASALVAFVASRTELFHDKNLETYGQDNQTHETRRLESRHFRDWLVAVFYEETAKSARSQSVKEAIDTLSGLGRHRGDCRDVYIRVAHHDGSYYLDLAEVGQNRAVKISAGRWEVVSNPPVRFIRPETSRPLPEPLRGGDINTLWKIANIPEHSRLIVIAWLCECLRPDTPFPVLELIGEQGSAKSTTQAFLRRLIDPNGCDLRGAPKVVEDIFVSAGSTWVVSYENISHLPGPMQDALCILATGGGFAKRKLYTDADESVIVVKRPVILNGISVAITAQDLIDRTLSVETPVIDNRKEVTDLWRVFDAEHGRLLGALLEIVAIALSKLPKIKLPSAERPRLYEFALFGMAIAEAMGKTGIDFLTQFNLSRQESIARSIDASPVSTAIIDWFSARSEQGCQMSAKDLMADVERYKPTGNDAWPRSARGFGDALRRAAPALRQYGIECRSLGNVGGHVKWEVKQKEKLPGQRHEHHEVMQDGSHGHDVMTSMTLPTHVCPSTARNCLRCDGDGCQWCR